MSFLKNVFKHKATKTGIIFIVEDNKIYSAVVKKHIETRFPGLKEVKVFPVGETCITELDRNPDLIIVDYFLDSKYPDAETGVEFIKDVRARKPQTNIVVLSAQQEINVALEAVEELKCIYIKKDTEALEKITKVISEIES
jgi:two-component system OmpR family response regulator